MLYHLARFILKNLFKMLFRLKVIGCENIPQKGPAIIAANHSSFLDPPLIGVSLKRDVYFLARESLFKVWGFGALIRKVHAFPIKGGVLDTTGLKTILRLLNEGKIVLLFPEGTRSRDGNIQEPRLGVGMLAYNTKVPVIPALITGANKALPRGAKIIRFYPITVHFGKPIFLEDYFSKEKNKKTYKLISEKITEEIKSLSIRS